MISEILTFFKLIGMTNFEIINWISIYLNSAQNLNFLWQFCAELKFNLYDFKVCHFILIKKRLKSSEIININMMSVLNKHTFDYFNIRIEKIVYVGLSNENW